MTTRFSGSRRNLLRGAGAATAALGLSSLALPARAQAATNLVVLATGDTLEAEVPHGTDLGGLDALPTRTRRRADRGEKRGGDRSVRGSITSGAAGTRHPRSTPRNEVRGFVANVDPPK